MFDHGTRAQRDNERRPTAKGYPRMPDRVSGRRLRLLWEHLPPHTVVPGSSGHDSPEPDAQALRWIRGSRPPLFIQVADKVIRDAKQAGLKRLELYARLYRAKADEPDMAPYLWFAWLAGRILVPVLGTGDGHPAVRRPLSKARLGSAEIGVGLIGWRVPCPFWFTKLSGAMFTTAQVALLISLVALCVAVIGLWATHLRPFTLQVLTSPPRLRFYPITGFVTATEKKTWWIPSFDIAVSLYNTGRRPGRVQSLRIVTRTQIGGSAEPLAHTFSPRWVVDYAAFHELGAKRSAWLRQSIKRLWYPLLLEPGQTHFHLVLEAMRWDELIDGHMTVTVEVATKAPDRFSSVGEYTVPLRSEVMRDNFVTASPAQGSASVIPQ